MNTFISGDGGPVQGAPAPLPCPFCASTDVEVFADEEDSLPAAFAQCSHCGAAAGHISVDGEQVLTLEDCELAAARAWNTRATGEVIPLRPRRQELRAV